MFVCHNSYPGYVSSSNNSQPTPHIQPFVSQVLTMAFVANFIKKHPKRTIASIIAPPVAIAVTPVLLAGVGFTAGGIAAGMLLSLLSRSFIAWISDSLP